MAGWGKTVRSAAIVAGIIWFMVGVAAYGQLLGGSFPMSPLVIGSLLVIGLGIVGGPALGVAGGILGAISERRQTYGEWIGWALLVTGLAWAFFIGGYALLFWSLPGNDLGRAAVLALIGGGIGVLAWQRSAM